MRLAPSTLDLSLAAILDLSGPGEPHPVSFNSLERDTLLWAEVLSKKCAAAPECSFARIAILSSNSLSFVSAYLALQRLGLSAVLLNARLSPADWKKQLLAAECRFLLLADEFLEQDLGLSSLFSYSLSEIAKEVEEERAVKQKASGLPWSSELRESTVIFTSGSEGHAKGVRISHSNFLESAAGSNQRTKLGPSDIWLVSLPLFHLGGLGILARTLEAGATAALIPGFSTTELVRACRRCEVTHLSLVPTMLEEILESFELTPSLRNEVFGSLKSVIVAGASASSRLWELCERHEIPVISAWGMTETTAHCVCTEVLTEKYAAPGVGKPFTGTALSLRTIDGASLEQQSTEGEIWVKGPTICLGYLDKEISLDDRWLRTGDLGRFDSEGNLFISGRIDGMFISGGENIHRSEIETLAEDFPGVLRVAVLALPHKKWGHRPILLIESGEEVNLEELAAYLENSLPKLKRPEAILQQTIAQTAIGKVDYKKLEQEFRDFFA